MGARETFARWVLVCADGGTALNHGTKKTDLKDRVRTYQASTGAEASISTAQNHFPLPNETDLYTLVVSPPCLALLFIFADGEMEGMFGSYLDNSHIVPSPPSCFRGGSTSGPAIEPVRNPAVREPFGTTLSSHCSRIAGAL